METQKEKEIVLEISGINKDFAIVIYDSKLIEQLRNYKIEVVING